MGWNDRFKNISNDALPEDGDYEILTQTAKFRTLDSGQDQLIVPFAVAEGPHQGAEAKLIFWLNEKGEKYLHGAMNAVNPDILQCEDENKALEMFMNNVSNAKLHVTQKTNGQYVNLYLRSGKNSHKEAPQPVGVGAAGANNADLLTEDDIPF